MRKQEFDAVEALGQIRALLTAFEAMYSTLTVLPKDRDHYENSLYLVSVALQLADEAYSKAAECA